MTILNYYFLGPRNERQKMEMEFVKNNPSSIVSAFTLSVYSTTWGKEKSKELFDKFSIENKNSEFGEKITKYIELNKEPKIGDQFADFEMEDQNGILKKLSLSCDDDFDKDFDDNDDDDNFFISF